MRINIDTMKKLTKITVGYVDIIMKKMISLGEKIEKALLFRFVIVVEWSFDIKILF